MITGVAIRCTLSALLVNHLRKKSAPMSSKSTSAMWFTSMLCTRDARTCACLITLAHAHACACTHTHTQTHTHTHTFTVKHKPT